MARLGEAGPLRARGGREAGREWEQWRAAIAAGTGLAVHRKLRRLREFVNSLLSYAIVD